MPDRPWWADLTEGDIPSEEDVPLPQPPAERLPDTPTPPDAVTLITVRDALAEWVEEERRPDTGIVTGWATLDSGLDRTLRAAEVVLVAARTGVGKTWGIQHLIEQALQTDEHAAAVLHEMEMPAYQIAERIAAHALGASPRRARRAARRGEIDPDDLLRQHPYLERLLICERTVPVDRLPVMLEAARQRGQWPTILAVDYFGLLGWAGSPRATLYERASENARRLKSVAVDERILIIVAAQLSRGAGAGDQEPELSDLRDSGVSEEAADRVLMLWRDPMVEQAGDAPPLSDSDHVWVKIAKNRFGPIGFRTQLRYDHAMMLTETGETT